VGPAAALATLRKYLHQQVERKLIVAGNAVKDIWREASRASGVEVKISGLPTLAAFSASRADGSEFNTKFTIEMLKLGFLGFRQFKPSLAHDRGCLTAYSQAAHKVFQRLGSHDTALELITPKHHSSFQRLTKE